MNSQNPYEILQVSINAESEVIDAAYRKLAFKYHPDRYFGIDADEKMKNINWAYSILGDPQKRIMYDVSMKPHNQQNQQEKLSVTNSKEYLEDSPEKRIQNARKILDITGSIGWMFIAYFVCAIILLSILPLSMQQYIIPGVFVFLVIMNIISRSVREKLLTKDELIRERKEEEQLTNSGR